MMQKLPYKDFKYSEKSIDVILNRCYIKYRCYIMLYYRHIIYRCYRHNITSILYIDVILCL